MRSLKLNEEDKVAIFEYLGLFTIERDMNIMKRQLHWSCPASYAASVLEPPDEDTLTDRQAINLLLEYLGIAIVRKFAEPDHYEIEIKVPKVALK